jgi:hypothetical protein
MVHFLEICGRGTKQSRLHLRFEAITRRSKRRLSRIAKGLTARCQKHALARIAKGDGLIFPSCPFHISRLEQFFLLLINAAPRPERRDKAGSKS